MNKEGLLIHSSTAGQIDIFVANPSHALTLLGPKGSGKYYVARQIAAQLLNLADEAELAGQAYFKHVWADKANITIDQIRELQAFLKLKLIGENARRIVLIENAQLLTTEAQNALLKMLEEPPANTIFILTATAEHSLLPTTISRTQRTQILPASLASAQKYFSKFGHPELEIERAFRISFGLPGLMHALLDNDHDHDLIKSIEQAKQLFKQPVYQRLLGLDIIIKDKEQIQNLLFAMQRLLQARLQTGSNTDKRVLAAIRLIYDTQNALQHNPNPKLLMTNLLLNL